MYKQIISSTQVNAWTAGTPAVSVGTVQGCSIKLINQTQYELQVFNGTEQIDTVPPFSFIISPYENDLNVSLDKSNASTVLVSPYQYVAFKRIKGVVSYQTGSTTFPGNTPVTGQVDITNTLNVNTAPGDTVTVAGQVTLPSTQQVVLPNTQQVLVAQASGAALNIGSVQSITDIVQNQVVNDYITSNGYIATNAYTATITNLANGSSITFDGALTWPIGFYSGMVLVGKSTTTGTVYSVQANLNAFANGTILIPATNPDFSQTINNNLPQSDLNSFQNLLCNRCDLNFTNNTGSTVASDTISIQGFLMPEVVRIGNPASSPVPTQSQYMPTQYNLGSYTFGSTTLAANSVGASQFTGSVSMTNVTKAQLLVQQTASSGFVDASPGAGIGFQLQGSNDNSTWYAIAGDANNPTSMTIIINGVYNQAADQTAIPAIISGYAYVRWAIYLVNGTTASVTMSESCTVYMQTLEG